MVLVLYMEVFKWIFKCLFFWLDNRCGEWEGWAFINLSLTTSVGWLFVVAPADRPMSVRSRCITERGVFCVYYVSCRSVFHTIASDLVLFLSIWANCQDYIDAKELKSELHVYYIFTVWCQRTAIHIIAVKVERLATVCWPKEKSPVHVSAKMSQRP